MKLWIIHAFIHKLREIGCWHAYHESKRAYKMAWGEMAGESGLDRKLLGVIDDLLVNEYYGKLKRRAENLQE